MGAQGIRGIRTHVAYHDVALRIQYGGWHGVPFQPNGAPPPPHQADLRQGQSWHRDYRHRGRAQAASTDAFGPSRSSAKLSVQQVEHPDQFRRLAGKIVPWAVSPFGRGQNAAAEEAGPHQKTMNVLLTGTITVARMTRIRTPIGNVLGRGSPTDTSYHNGPPPEDGTRPTGRRGQPGPPSENQFQTIIACKLTPG